MVLSQELERGQPFEHSVSFGDEGAEIVLLATAAAQGDEHAFADLYTLLSQRVFNLVLRSVHDRPTAEDLCQEIWLRAHREIRGLRAPKALRAWLYRIASRACVDFARSSRGKHRGEEDDIDEYIVAYGLQPEECAIVDSEVRMVWETLGAMAPRQSMALYLKQVDGLSYDEIAAVLECTRPTVEALLFRARQSFVRAYQRVESSPAERCDMFWQVMASVVDNEPTQLQRTALDAHASDCPACRAGLADARKANKAYLALPLLPIGKGLALEAILAGGGTSAGTGILGAAAGLFGAGALPAKIVLVGVLVATSGAVATGQIYVPEVSHHLGIEEVGPEETTLLVDITPGTSPPGPTSTQPTASSNSHRSTGTNEPIADAATIAGANDSPVVASNSGAANTNSGSNGNSANTRDPAGQSGSDAGTPVTLPAGPPAAGSGTADGSTPDAGDGADPAAPGSTSVPGTTEPQGTTEPAPLTSLLGDTALGALLPLEALDEVVNDVTTLAGDTVQAVTAPVTTLIEPVDNSVENLTGLSVNETLDDVTGLLPSSNATPVPLDETVEDVLEPVSNLLQNPVQPVQNLLEDPLKPVEDITGPLLGPILGPTPAPTTAPPASSTPPPSQADPPCLLGLLLC